MRSKSQLFAKPRAELLFLPVKSMFRSSASGHGQFEKYRELFLNARFATLPSQIEKAGDLDCERCGEDRWRFFVLYEQ